MIFICIELYKSNLLYLNLNEIIKITVVYMALYIAGQLITMTIGRHLLSKAINDSTSNIYSSLSSIYYYSKSAKKLIKELDIENKLRTIETTCTTLDESCIKSRSVENCLEAIHEIILNIKCDLNIINKKLAKHKKKYFNSWRSLNVKKHISDLEFHCGILDKRYDLLANTITILHNNNI
uniref:Uncharacterized protein n=1 Tax=viral metagenome TaxID=1070528 RepID=A0A6C0B486_9ZZZZ